MSSPQRTKRFYGLYVVAACFWVLFMCWGMVINTFPIFLKPIAEDMHWGRGALALALLIGALGTGVSAPIVGLLVDRLGARSVMAVGAAIIGFGLLAGSRVTHLWQLYGVFAFMGAGLMASTIIPCSLVVSNWFVSRRVKARQFPVWSNSRNSFPPFDVLVSFPVFSSQNLPT